MSPTLYVFTCLLLSHISTHTLCLNIPALKNMSSDLFSLSLAQGKSLKSLSSNILPVSIPLLLPSYSLCLQMSPIVCSCLNVLFVLLNLISFQKQLDVVSTFFKFFVCYFPDRFVQRNACNVHKRLKFVSPLLLI
jgi:hypothetical protein